MTAPTRPTEDQLQKLRSFMLHARLGPAGEYVEETQAAFGAYSVLLAYLESVEARWRLLSEEALAQVRRGEAILSEAIGELERAGFGRGSTEAP